MKMETRLSIATAGLNRFYDEGFTKWSEEKLRPLFSGARLDESEIEERLHEWEHRGFVKRKNQTECFLEVLKPIE